MVDTGELNALDREPTADESLRAGADLVCVSGDKLFGGPQAGIIAGRAAFVRDIKREPFFRALRCDKLILAALEETAIEYLEINTARDSPVPVLAMLALTDAELMPRAEKIVAAIDGLVRIGRGTSRCGGGTMPRSAIESVTLDLRPTNEPVESLARRLRLGHPPVIAYVSEGVVKIDLRTVLPTQDDALISALAVAGNSGRDDV
jgi:L-seryl-tRNA(Ser) seleniumtransferase